MAQQPKNPFQDEELTVRMGQRDPLTVRGQSAAKSPGRTPTVEQAAAKIQPRTPTVEQPAARAPPGKTGAPMKPAAPTKLPAPAKQRSGAGSLTAIPQRKEEGVRYSSTFDSVDQTRTNTRLGRTVSSPGGDLQPAKRTLSRDEMKAVATRFDGTVVPASVAMSSSNLRPVEPEVASTPGSRDPLLSRVVLDQFAPETNPRYARREAGHIFVWDFANAMGCKVPRYRATGELTLEQVCSWFRTLGTDAGWIKITGQRAVELATGGAPVIALPRNPRLMLLAVARPDEQGSDGLPLLSSACQRQRGSRLTAAEAFGERHADYYFHE